MKYFKQSSIAFLIAVVCMAEGFTIKASVQFKDVANSHWAYPSISLMAEAGFIVGDSSGKYSPNQILDKFSAVQILAKASGFSYVNLTNDVKNMIEQAYTKHKSTLSRMHQEYPKAWLKNTDKEIAFLLEKQVLTPEDLQTFVKKTNKGEQKYALTREEAAMFLVKLAKKEQEASFQAMNFLFYDDMKINPNYKKYIYYLREQQVIRGDENGNFNPKATVTKAAMAVMLDKTLSMEEKMNSNTPNHSESGINQIEYVSGQIENVFLQFQALQISGNFVNGNIFVNKGNSKIILDEQNASLSSLKVGMYVQALVNHTTRELIEVIAKSSSSPSGQQPANPTAMRSVYGTITNINQIGGRQMFEIETKILTPYGQVIADKNNYQLAVNGEIIKANKKIEFAYVNVGDVVTAKAMNFELYQMTIEQKENKFAGTIVDKGLNQYTGDSYITVELKDGLQKTVTLNQQTFVRRNNSSVGTFALKVGDSVDVIAEYNIAKDILAEGKKKTINGIIEEVFISEKESKILVKNTSDNKKEHYRLSQGIVDTRLLQVGVEVEISLDSNEITQISIIRDVENKFISGKVIKHSSYDSYVIVEDSYSKTEKKVYYDNKTVFIDAYDGSKISYDRMQAYLRNNRLLNITYTTRNDLTLYAKTMTVVN